MDSRVILRACLLISSMLVIAIYFIYRPNSWPIGFEALGCLVTLLVLNLFIFLLWRFRSKPVIRNAKRNISIGLTIGLLWTVEIGINNIIQPGLPLRDIIDNIFWAAIALLILVFASVESFRSRKISAGIISGFWSGTASGAIACLTALVLIVFGMNLLISDPLNIKEWSDIHKNLQYPDMKVYFAYQTFAGALLHLTVLGIIMGLVIGVLGGIIGISMSNFLVKNKN